MVTEDNKKNISISLCATYGLYIVLGQLVGVFFISIAAANYRQKY